MVLDIVKKKRTGGLLALDYLYNIPGNPGAHKGFRGSCNRTLRCLAPVVGWWGARILKLTFDDKLFLNVAGRYTQLVSERLYFRPELFFK